MLRLHHEVAQNGVVETEIVFDVGERGVRALHVQENIMSLDQLLDRVGELTTAPILDTFNLSTLFENKVLVAFDHRRNLFRLIRMHDDADFVMTH